MLVLVECSPDKLLINKLGFYAECVRGKGNVCMKLKRGKAHVGMIDEDPWSNNIPKYVQN